MAKFGYRRPAFTLICWFFGDKLGEKCSELWQLFEIGWDRPFDWPAMYGHCTRKGHWIGLDNPLESSVEMSFSSLNLIKIEDLDLKQTRMVEKYLELMRSVELEV